MSTLHAVTERPRRRRQPAVLPRVGWGVVLTLPATGRITLMLHQVAMALHLSGAQVDRDLTPTQAAALIRAACEQVGPARVREGDQATGRAVLAWLDGCLDRRPQMWSDTRAQACTDAAFRLTCAVARGELAPAVDYLTEVTR